MSDKPIIVWFRNDLRICDHPALFKAAQSGALPKKCEAVFGQETRPTNESSAKIIPIFIYDANAMGEWDYGAAQKYWLHHTLLALKQDLPNLVLRRGNTMVNLLEIAKKYNAQSIYTLRNYEPWSADLERDLNEICNDEGIEFKRFAGNLLIEPERLKNKSGNDFQIYTPFFKAVFSSDQVRKPIGAPPSFETIEGIESDNLDDWGFLPKNPDWTGGFMRNIGEKAAHQRLEDFLPRIENYSNGRDIPSQNSTSYLAPHLRFGEISPAQIWAKIHEICPKPIDNYYKFLAEIGWREFSYHLLSRHPKMPNRPLKSQFENFPWVSDEKSLKAWQKGQTGYPIVDAGMRQLWQTGYMHNRVRMIVASFLVKHLMIPWQDGAKYFWDCLLDGDLANNSAGWQWVAGCGSDAAPYFRIFNPIMQGQKFDANGEYVRKWVPELAKLPNEFIHFPKDAPTEVLKSANVILGRNYPLPIVDHKFARERALEGLESLKSFP